MERIGIYKDLKVSYGEFTKALSQLGYYKMPTDEATLYINDDYDSIIRISNHHKPDKMMLLAVFTSEAYLMEMKGVIESRDYIAKMIEQDRLDAAAREQNTPLGAAA